MKLQRNSYYIKRWLLIETRKKKKERKKEKKMKQLTEWRNGLFLLVYTVLLSHSSKPFQDRGSRNHFERLSRATQRSAGGSLPAKTTLTQSPCALKLARRRRRRRRRRIVPRENSTSLIFLPLLLRRPSYPPAFFFYSP